MAGFNIKNVGFNNKYQTAEVAYFFSDLFDSDNWTDQGTGFGVASGKLTGVAVRSSTNDASWKDMGSALSDTTWIARFPLDITVYAGAGASTNNLFIGFSSTSGASGINVARDGLGMYLNNESASKKFVAIYPNGVTWATTESVMTTTPTVAIWYIEYIRLSATSFTINLYSDSGYSTLVESKNVTCSSGVIGLQYPVFQNNNDTGSSVNTITASILEIFVKNGVSSW